MVDYVVYASNETRSKLFHSIKDVRDYCINKAVFGNATTEAFKTVKTKNGSYLKPALKCTPVRGGRRNTFKMVEY